MTRSALVHVGLLGIGVLLLISLYLLQQNVTSVALGLAALVAAHLIVFGGLLYLGRRWVTRLLQKVTHTLDRL